MTLPVLAVLPMATTSTPLTAATLSIEQDSERGTGTGFRRNNECLVLTAAHVIQNPRADVTVRDSRGASTVASIEEYGFVDDDAALTCTTGTDGSRSCEPRTDDFALLRFDLSAGVECVEQWPDSSWMESADLETIEFDVVRESEGGRKKRIFMRWSGGFNREIMELQTTDGTLVEVSDSGSLVRLAGKDRKPVGIVLSALTGETQRLHVLRFDTIERNLGQHFRARGDVLVSLDSVSRQGRDVPVWREYVASWFSEAGTPTVVSPGHPQASCRVEVNILDMSFSSVPNTARIRAQERLTSCKDDILIRNSKRLVASCESGARQDLQRLPHRTDVVSVQMQVGVTDASERRYSNLATNTFESAAGEGVSRADMELFALNKMFGIAGAPLLQQAGCMQAAALTEERPKRGARVGRFFRNLLPDVLD